MSCVDCGAPCQGRRCQPCQLAFECEGDARADHETDENWFECAFCGARYRNSGLALICCSTPRNRSTTNRRCEVDLGGDA